MSSGRTKRPGEVHTLYHILREAAVRRGCLIAFFILTQKSLGHTMVSQRVPIKLHSLLLATWAQLTKWWQRCV